MTYRGAWGATVVAVGTAALLAPPAVGETANGVIAYSMVEQSGPRSWIELVRPNGEARRRFPCTTGAFASCRDSAPAFSRDGRRLAVTNGREIVVARLNGHLLRRIPVAAITVAWAPGGRRLAYTAEYADAAAPMPHVRHAVYVTALDEPARRRAVARDVDPWGLSWSSRGLLVWEQIGDRRGIYVGDAHGQDSRRIRRTRSSAHVPRWSFDGGRLAYECEPYWCTVRPDGTRRRLLDRRCSTGSDLGALAWAPDGRRAACIGRRSGDIISVRLGAGERSLVRRRSLSGRFLPDQLAWQRSPSRD